MASRISQMRNEMFQSPQQQQQLNNSIQQVKQLMDNIKNSSDPQAFMNSIFESNPQLETLSKQPNLYRMAQKMAQERGIDLNDLVRQLTGVSTS